MRPFSAIIQPNSVARDSDTFGILKLTLHPTSYDWKFVPEAGKTYTDSGTHNCFISSSTSPTSVPPATKTPISNPTSIGPTPTATVLIPSDSYTFAPVADAYVTAAIPNTNYSSSQQIRFDTSPIVKSYLTFNVQGLTAPIASVKLKIYANSSSSQGFKVHAVPTTSWGEKSITYTNAPGLGNQIGTSGAFAGATWVTVDVTSLVTGNGPFSLALTGLNATVVSLASRESGANAPELIITTR